jgi:hypothetical protein
MAMPSASKNYNYIFSTGVSEAIASFVAFGCRFMTTSKQVITAPCNGPATKISNKMNSYRSSCVPYRLIHSVLDCFNEEYDGAPGEFATTLLMR